MAPRGLDWKGRQIDSARAAGVRLTTKTCKPAAPVGDRRRCGHLYCVAAACCCYHARRCVRPATSCPMTEIDIAFQGVSKTYGSVVAVDRVDLEIPTGAFVSLLGPSGCGKTTSLRIIAGFEQPTAGDVLIGGKSVVGVPAYRRPVNMVFQNYALFPHLNVSDNVAFGLRQLSPRPSRRQVEAEVDARPRARALARLWQPAVLGAVGRPAAAGGAGPRSHQQAQGPAPRRAARGPRPQAAARHADRASEPPAIARHHLRAGHPRPGRGAVDERPRVHHARWPHRPVRPAEDALR